MQAACTLQHFGHVLGPPFCLAVPAAMHHSHTEQFVSPTPHAPTYLPPAGRKLFSGFSAYSRASKAWPCSARQTGGAEIVRHQHRVSLSPEQPPRCHPDPPTESRASPSTPWAHPDGQLLLPQRQRLPRRHPQLPLHQVLPRDGLGDWVLHLRGRSGHSTQSANTWAATRCCSGGKPVWTTWTVAPAWGQLGGRRARRRRGTVAALTPLPPSPVPSRSLPAAGCSSP